MTTHKLSNEIVDSRINGRTIKRIGEYVNSQTKIKWKCLLDGYEWYAAPNKIISKTQRGCPKCAGRIIWSNQEFDNKLKTITDKIQRLDDYSGSGCIIRWKCLIDGHEWLARPGDILQGSGCPKCSKHLHINNDCVDKRIKELNLPIIRLGNISTSRCKIKWKCLIDGYEWFDNPNIILNVCCRKELKYKYFGCKECRRRERIIKHNAIVDELILNKKIKRISDYTKSSEKIKFYCESCNKNFSSTYSDVVYSSSGCPYCKLKGENFIHSILVSQFPHYKTTRQFVVRKNDVDKRHKFVIDFVLSHENENLIFVEFNGSQHYKPTKFNSKTSDQEIHQIFAKQQKRDMELKLYCENNGILFVEIPYWIIQNYNESRVVNYINKKLKGLIVNG